MSSRESIKTHLNKFKRIKIIKYALSGLKLEINNRIDGEAKYLEIKQHISK